MASPANSQDGVWEAHKMNWRNNMKRIIVLLFILMASNAYAQIGISWGILGAGFSANKYPDSGYAYVQALNFSYQTNFGLGFSLSPLDAYYYFAGENDSSITFVNISSYFDFIKDDSLLLAPFIMSRLVDLNEPYFSEFRTGIRFSINNLYELFSYNSELERSIFKDFSLIAEIGYNYNKAQHGYYAYLGIDIISALFLIGSGKFGENPQDNKEF
jgi:hypothetical protein